MATLTPTPDQTSIQGACNQANPGDTVQLPDSGFLIGENGVPLTVTKPITVTGADRAASVMVLAGNGPTGGAVQNTGGATISNLSVIPAAGVPAFSISGKGGSRLTGINYNPGMDAAVAYFAVYGGVYGCIDNCRIIGGAGNNELIFARGPLNSWQTPNSLGTDQCVLVESCLFDGPGYVCDANSNARMTVRYSTILGNMKVDGHGLASNTPPRGVRQFECYRNHWTNTQGWYVLASEMRGGTGVWFDNVADHPLGASAYFEDYGYQGLWPNFGAFQTPKNYPIRDQIGNGMDGGPREPFYAWNNLSGGKPWQRSLKTPAPAAIALYGQPFAETDIIKEGRDLFSDMSGLAVPNVGRGTTAAMHASKPTLVGQGWLATDQGQWNTLPAPNNQQGVLNVWNGAIWTPKYIPLRYPYYPLPSAVAA
jgi:hypothetical protein